MQIKLQKIPKNIYYMSSLSSTWPSNHLNNKFKQKFLKVPEGPKLGRKIMTCIYRTKKKKNMQMSPKIIKKIIHVI